MDRVIVFNWHGSTFRITSWGAEVASLIVILIAGNVAWFAWRRQYRKAIGIAASSVALLTWPFAMTLIEDVGPPRRLLAFVAYAALVLSCAIAFRTWLIAGALVGLFSLVFMSSPGLSSDAAVGIVIAVAFGAFCGWLVEVELKRRRDSPTEKSEQIL